MGEVVVEFVNDRAEEDAKDGRGKAFALEHSFGDRQEREGINGTGEEQGSVTGFPEEGHDGSKVRGKGKECL